VTVATAEIAALCENHTSHFVGVIDETLLY